ncbi:hypothetical protein ODZ84_06230 [Chryseobacterium fluminis]|uniref:carbohydrate binding domain-containing protein n=1 Tax=Chryseobacterium fluminis TaxID=2983606 RepID=UPI002256A600|nr:carbohydrate binding domain-containing protein [Chryseobacterium sp. MMS21-Ot14]UZT99165.1 hypothetical protein ODZ84_06230 [Chryseobacterium sp. MMS21-Ot14]
MKKNYVAALLLCTATGFHAQQEIYFKYDEAGNQRYRGLEINEQVGKNSNSKRSLHTDLVTDEKTFWKQIRLYPVPVNDFLSIDWTQEADDLIQSISLFQHSTVHWKFQQQNLPGLNRQLRINMTGYEWGVYVLRFTLKDGRVFSKNITKR